MNFRSVLLKFSSDKMSLCNNNDQTWFSDTLTSARPLGVVKTFAFQARVSTPSLGSSRCLFIENMFDPYSGLSILLHGVILLADATSCDNIVMLIKMNTHFTTLIFEIVL